MIRPDVVRKYRFRAICYLSCTMVLWITAFTLAIKFTPANSLVVTSIAALCLLVTGFNYAGAFTTLCAATLFRNEATRFNLEADISSPRKTIVVIPCLLSSNRVIDSLLQSLLDHYNSSKSDVAAFILLADFADAKRMDEGILNLDAALLERAMHGIDKLNQEYCNVFGILVRQRIWAPAESAWMGRERKRGKLEALNKFLVDSAECEFDIVKCDLTLLANVDYVLTLDADTVLPEGVAKGLISTAALPSNSEYTIIQPGVRRCLNEPKSVYQWLTTSPFPPLSILQGIFGHSKFVGKGLYKVRDFNARTENVFPSNWILSHDVLESIHVRVLTIDESCILESNPESFEEACVRLHRWYRGDWQNIPWSLPSSIRYSIREFKSLRRFRVGFVGAWTIFDLIMRSIHAPFLMILIWISCLCKGGKTFLLIVLALEFLLAFITFLSKYLRGEEEAWHSRTFCVLLGATFFLMALPAHVVMAVDAATRSFWRMFISGRFRLQWKAMAEFKIEKSTQRYHFWTFTPALIFGLALTLASLFKHFIPGALIGVLWLIFPFLTSLLEKIRVAPHLQGNYPRKY
ncbi:hypothetical protein SNE35_05795 [Paucibacter sp. R3-3]|uniref:Glycosyltransferase 2-like domain-containing protein n=1 Tax=Roseateles agri TaxID=3098619 RepID=A0ABU5DCJ1_9BURK|nr:hypothetical protein [Paucibacter sp. R3-3]MDY0744005.1 hypothetical protein [Paucibacter sp. R3-3]